MKDTNSFLKDITESAEKRWNEFHTEARNANIITPDNPEMIAEIKQVFAFSDFVAKACIRNPALLTELIQTGDIQNAYRPEEYHYRLEEILSDVEEEDTLGARLRHLRRREMIRIAWRDITGRADLSETMKDLSDFADACIGHTLSLLYKWQTSVSGIPVGNDGKSQNLVVLGMGKLGAGELNFSSDIDLIFAYPETGQTIPPPATRSSSFTPLTNEEFFVRLCRRLIKVLGANTSDGILFRVDMGLRPYGESGPVVMSFDAMENYYQAQGREWERYAWIKARVAGGDKAAGRELLKRLNPFIYRRYLDFGVFEALRDMKHKIAAEVKRKGMKENIKLGSGGIREIEFFGQIFQLIRGGVIPSLQEPGIQKVMKILTRENYISPKVCRDLESAYIFLRNTEHRLQEFADQQTHKLPSDPLGRARLAASMQFSDWDAFESSLKEHTRSVHSNFSSLLKTEDSEPREQKSENALADVWKAPNHTEQNRDILRNEGFDNPDEVLQRLTQLKDDMSSVVITREGQDRIDRLMPLLLKAVSGSVTALKRILELISSVKRRTSYVSLLLENPVAMTHLVRFANESSWILAFMTRHPVLLDELLNTRTLYKPPKRPELERDIQHRLEQIFPDDLEYQMDELRIFRHVNTLRVAASDITEALPLMKVSDHLSDIAETVLNKVIDMAWRHLVEIHGKPVCSLNNGRFDRGFAIIAYGKLGGLELGYDSDLDLVFLHAGDQGETEGGKRPIDNAYFFARLGQRVIHILTTHTPAGTLYETDMRLRPSGGSGPLVCHIEGFRRYQLDEAWTWEKQALIRARFVSGNISLADRFEQIRRESLSQPRNEAELRAAVSEMRKRMRKELLKPEPDIFDLKQDRGGMVDIEFLVQYLVLLKSCEHPEMLQWTDNVRLIGSLAAAGVIDDITAHFLRKAYLTYRTVGHRLSLRHKPAKVSEERFQELRERVMQAWERFFRN